ncbi:ovocleidin-116-like [Apus apus]|uniref:ovocleidin-116-like n=1 Tax=Apus apus TaxID=8895 RepID=UPI0021F91CFC|nr:ovocleidin-116-like [Apus apus]
MQTALVCLCLLSTALSTPVPPLPGRAAGNCAGQHRILLKGCNAKHGFYIFKYVYSFSTRRNQTQIKKEEADRQNALGEDKDKQEPTEDRVALEQSENVSTDVMENNRTSLMPKSHTTPGVGRDALSPPPATSTGARGGIGMAGPTPTSWEGSGDLDLVVEIDGGVSIPTQDGRPGEAMVGNRSIVRGEDREEDGAPGWVPVERAMTDERASATGGAGDEGSGGATMPGQGQEGVMQGTGVGSAALSSVTEKIEDVQVDTEGVDEYAYIPDSGSITVTQGKLGSTAPATSFTQISPDKDDEVNIFIGRANILVGEQETTQAGATAGSKDSGIPTAGTSSPLPRLAVTAAQDDDDGIPAHRQPEGLATTATPSYRDSTTSRPRVGYPTGDDEDGATTLGDGEGPLAPSPWTVTGGDIPVPSEAGIAGNGDDGARGEGQRFEGRSDRLPVTTPRQEAVEETTATVPAKGASISLGGTTASSEVREGNCTTALGMDGSCKAGETPSTARGASGEVGTTTLWPHREGRPKVGAGLQPGGAGLDKTARTDKAPSSDGKVGSQALSEAQGMAGGHSGDVGGRRHPTGAGGSPPGQAGQVWGPRRGRLPGRQGRRPGAPGALAALGSSRQVDQVRRADELHIRERAFYTLGGARAEHRGPYAALGSADSSQSSEGERGSSSDSRQIGLRPAGWGAPGHPQGRWSRGTL